MPPGHANAASGAWDGDARQARVGASRATVAMLILGNACRVAYPARRAGSHAIGAPRSRVFCRGSSTRPRVCDVPRPAAVGNSASVIGEADLRDQPTAFRADRTAAIWITHIRTWAESLFGFIRARWARFVAAGSLRQSSVGPCTGKVPGLACRCALSAAPRRRSGATASIFRSRPARRTGAPRKYLLPTPKHDSVRANTTWQRVANVRKLDHYVEGHL